MNIDVLPQALGTGASPTFVGLTLSGLTEGSIPFAGAGGVISQDNAGLFFNNSTNCVGIGAGAAAAAVVLDMVTESALNPRYTT